MPINLNNLATSARQVATNVSTVANNLTSAVNSFKTLGVQGILNHWGANKSSTAPTTAEFKDGSKRDWRVRLSFPPTEAFLTSPILSPLLTTGGLVFPYTPTISISHTASYQALEPVHNNYPFFSYQNSKIELITISGQFYCEDSTDAQYWAGAVHFLRSVTKMAYGDTTNTGAPPPVVRLNGYGDFVFNNIPVVVTNFTVELPNDVDYISTSLGSNTSLASESDTISYAPVRSNISISVQPIYSREEVRKFSLDTFVNGGYLDGRGYL